MTLYTMAYRAIHYADQPAELADWNERQTMYVRGPQFQTLTGLPAEVRELVVFGCPELQSIEWPPALEKLRIGDCPLLELKGQLPTTLCELRVEQCPGLLATLLAHAPASLSSLIVIGDDQLTAMTKLPSGLERIELRDCPQLTMVDCQGLELCHLSLTACNRLTAIRAQGEELNWLELKSCNLQALDLSQATAHSLTLDACVGRRVLRSHCVELGNLYLEGCDYLEEVVDLPPTVSLCSAIACQGLVTISGPGGAKPLTLAIEDCDQLARYDHPRLKKVALILGGNQGERWTRSLPSTVESLTCEGDFPSALASSPSLRRLSLLRSQAPDMALVSPNLKELTLYECHAIANVNSLPEGLERLSVEESSTDGQAWTRLPTTVRVLQLSGGALDLNSLVLPPDLEELELYLPTLAEVTLGRHPFLRTLEVSPSRVVTRGVEIQTLKQYQALWRPKKRPTQA